VSFWIIWICQLKAQHSAVALSSLLNSAHVTDLSKPLSSGNSLSRFDNAVLVAMLSPAEFTLRYARSRLEMCAIEFLNSDTIEENLAIIQLSFCLAWGWALQLWKLHISKRHSNVGPRKTRMYILSFCSAHPPLRNIWDRIMSWYQCLATWPNFLFKGQLI
jgi:hypothetical protein